MYQKMSVLVLMYWDIRFFLFSIDISVREISPKNKASRKLMRARRRPRLAIYYSKNNTNRKKKLSRALYTWKRSIFILRKRFVMPEVDSSFLISFCLLRYLTVITLMSLIFFWCIMHMQNIVIYLPYITFPIYELHIIYHHNF